jgi:hypothetical protein
MRRLFQYRPNLVRESNKIHGLASGQLRKRLIFVTNRLPGRFEHEEDRSYQAHQHQNLGQGHLEWRMIALLLLGLNDIRPMGDTTWRLSPLLLLGCTLQRNNAKRVEYDP